MAARICFALALAAALVAGEPQGAELLCAGDPKDCPDDYRVPSIKSVLPNAAPMDGGDLVTLEVLLPACFNYSNGTSGREARSFGKAACVWTGLGDDSTIVDSVNVFASESDDMLTAYVRCMTPKVNVTGKTTVSVTLDGGDNMAFGKEFRYTPTIDIFGMSPVQGPMTGNQPVTIAGSNLGTFGDTPWCDFGGVVSTGKLVKLSKDQLRPQCKPNCKNVTEEQGDGVIVSKTVCTKARCDSKEIESQRVRIVCFSPTGAGTTGAMTVKVAPSFSPAAFTRVPGDYTLFSNTVIASFYPKSISPKGSLVTLRINTEVPSRNVLCRFGHKEKLPPFKWEGGVTVAAVGHPLSTKADIILEKASSDGPAEDASNATAAFLETALQSHGHGKPAALAYPFNQVVQCVGPEVNMNIALQKASERVLKHLKKGTLLETHLAVSLDGGTSWSGVEHVLLEDAPVIQEGVCGGLVCGSHGTIDSKGTRSAGFSMVEVSAVNLDLSGTGEFMCRFGSSEQVKAIRLNVSTLACFTPPRGLTCGSQASKPSAASATPQGKPCTVSVEVSSNGGASFSSTVAQVKYGPMPQVSAVSAKKGRAGDSYWAEIDNMTPGVEYWFKFGMSFAKATKEGNATNSTATNGKVFRCKVPASSPPGAGNEVSVSNNGIIFVPSGNRFEYIDNVGV